MMSPKRTKYRKAHKGRIHGVATSGATLSFGQFGLKAMAPERITARQIEAARRALTFFPGHYQADTTDPLPLFAKPPGTGDALARAAIKEFVNEGASI